MKFKLKIWRQKDAKTKGKFAEFELDGIEADMSFLEMMDILNDKILKESPNEEPISFDSDCREGICGMCSMVVNGRAHGKIHATTTCQLYMRNFEDGETIYIEPFRAKPFPIIQDLCVNRNAFDEIIQAGGFISANVGGAPDANLIPIPKDQAEMAMDAASCIGCGACVAACKNSSAMLFVSAKVSHLSLLPQGKTESKRRVQAMVAKMDELGFGNCTNEAECEAECPKEIKIHNISRLNREYISAGLSRKEV